MNPKNRKKYRLQVETLEGRMVLSSGALTSGLGGVIAVPAVVAPEAGAASTQATRPTLQLGSKGEDVKYLQSSLQQLKYSVGPAGVDGDFGPDTEKAVVAFQKANPPLAAKGIVDPQTWAVLKAKQNPGQLAIDEAEEHLGYREGPNNDNMFSDYYKRPHEQWCADFVSYSFEMAGYPIGKPKVGFSFTGDIVDWFKAKKAWDEQPAVGAVIAFNWHDGGTIYDHVGIVTKVTGSQITYISGNTTDPKDPSGGSVGVFVHTISRDSSSIIGYGHM